MFDFNVSAPENGMNTFWPEELASWQGISSWPFLKILSSERLNPIDRNKFLSELSLRSIMGNYAPIIRRKTCHSKDLPRFLLKTIKKKKKNKMDPERVSSPPAMAPPGRKTWCLRCSCLPNQNWDLGEWVFLLSAQLSFIFRAPRPTCHETVIWKSSSSVTLWSSILLTTLWPDKLNLN